MLIINLSSREIELLKAVFKNKNQYFQITENSVFVENNFQENLEKIIDIISNYFLKYGLNRHDEPNELGFELESLNDKFIEKLQFINS